MLQYTHPKCPCMLGKKDVCRLDPGMRFQLRVKTVCILKWKFKTLGVAKKKNNNGPL